MIGTLIILIIVGFFALVWIISEPISGLIGSGFIAKIIALWLAYRLVCWMLS